MYRKGDPLWEWLNDKVGKGQLTIKQPIEKTVVLTDSCYSSELGERFYEAGHIGQNLFLQAESLGLKAGIVGAFHDNKVIQVMNIPHTHEPLLIMPIGYPA